MAPKGAVYIVPRLGGDSKNLRTTFNKLVTRAGLTPWARPFANLRSTRATELAEVFPLKTVAEWMGHDARVSLNHYQQVRDEHWSKAIEQPTARPVEAPRNAMRAGATNTTVLKTVDSHRISKFDTVQSFAPSCEVVQTRIVPPRGLEPFDAKSCCDSSLHAFEEAADAQCAAPASEDLQMLVSVWPILTDDVRSAILELVRPAAEE